MLTRIIIVSLLMLLTACVTEQKYTQSAAEKKDSLADISTNRALSYMRIKQYKTAEEILTKELSRSPNSSKVNYAYALLKLQLKTPELAGKYFARAVKSDPENAAAAHDYGFYLCSNAEIEKGVEMFDLAINNPLFEHKGKKSKHNAATLFLGYRIEKLAGAIQEAEKYRTMLLKEHPGSSEASKLRKFN